jgi:beta-galactosidase
VQNKNLLMKSYLKKDLLSVLILITALHTFAAHSVEDLRKQKFDYNWKFKLGDHPAAIALNFDDKDWRNIDLPHDWSIEGKVNAKNPSGNDGGYFPTGIGWYRKTFMAPASFQNKKITVYFEGVYTNAEVFINGKSLGIRPYGYSSFSYDLTPYLNYRASNVIAVKVDNSAQKNSRWYSGSGIYRHVWLMVTDPVHIEQWGVAITTPKVSKEKASVVLETQIENETDQVQKFTLVTHIEHGQRDGAKKNEVQLTLAPNESRKILQTIVVEQPLLWSIDQPNLYNAVLTVLRNQQKVDQLQIPFGIRTLSFSTDRGFLLNGKKVVINGGCAHHDNGALGAAAYDRAEVKKVELLKAAGFNSVRTSHNPPSTAFLDACDRLGLLVMDESFDGWRSQKTTHDYAQHFDQWCERDVAAMVLRDRNHPAVIMWSTGNEIIERKELQAVTTATKLAKLVRSLDPSRPVTSAITTWDSEWAIFDPLFAAHDVGGYNYQLHRAVADHQRVPSRIIVQTESYPRDAFANWKLVKENSYIIGDYVWTAMDYLGESGIGRHYYTGDTPGEHYERDMFPWHGAYCGDIDLIGWRKPISHYREMLYNEDQKLYMAVKEPDGFYGKIKETMWSVWPTWESWTWPGHDGKDIDVAVYSRYPKVRLYLNNKLIGEKETREKQEFKAIFTLRYAAGKLKAVGVVNGKEQGVKYLQTAGKATKIKLTADRMKLSADGQDLSYVTIDLTDEQGIIQPNAANRLKFEIAGEGTILAVSNANLKDEGSYSATERNAWHGKAQVVIKSTHHSGTIKLKVSGAGLPVATLMLQTVKN